MISYNSDWYYWCEWRFFFAWSTCQTLALNNIPGGVGPKRNDGIDYTTGSGWAHPVCSAAAKAASIKLGAGS